MVFLNLLDLAIALMYFLGALLFVAGMLGRSRSLKRASLIGTVAGFALHTADLGLKVARTAEFSFAQGQFYFSLLAWSFLLIFLLVLWRQRLEFLALTAAPLALILFSSSMVVNTAELPFPSELAGLWFGLHVAALFFSIGLLGMAFGSGLGYLYLDRQIKNKAKLNKYRKNLPSLTSFDRINHWAVSIGFPLFTIGVLAGFLWARFTWDRIFSWDPKELVSIVIWFLFAYLFHQRLAVGWKGRKPARLASWLFVFCIVSMLVVNFYLPTHHSFRP
jgi:ABC-type transport system involved in cytochrome c biogenesis permease subunit